MAANQTATVLVTGTTGITVPPITNITVAGISTDRIGSLVDPAYTGDTSFVKVIVDWPTITATAKTVEVCMDNTNWRPVNSDIFQLQAFPTAATFTGNKLLHFGPYLPGTEFRVTGGAVNTGTMQVYFGI